MLSSEDLSFISGCCNEFLENNDNYVKNLDTYNLKNLLAKDFDKYEAMVEHAIKVANNSEFLKKNSIKEKICEFICQEYNESDYYIPEGSVVLYSNGRLGNQMYNFLSAQVLAEKLNTTLYVLPGQRPILLGNFTLNDDSNLIYKNELNTYYQSQLNSSIDGAFNYLGKKFLLEEVKKVDYNKYLKDFKTGKKILILDSHFEIDSIVEEYHGLAQEIFKIKNLNQSKISLIHEQITQPNSVCIHIRRDDVSPTQNSYRYMTTEYFKAAIEISNTKIEDANFYVFSDEIKRAKEELSDITNIEFIDGNSASEDMYLLSKCANNIISKSSFSFWAIALKNEHSGLIIAPKSNSCNNFYRKIYNATCL